MPTRWSCRTGVCHTCATAVVAGEASYDTPSRGRRAVAVRGSAHERPGARPVT
ncbi:2Fe-2S iron-sulfur cluster-binding protein [Nocardioides sp. AN3]